MPMTRAWRLHLLALLLPLLLFLVLPQAEAQQNPILGGGGGDEAQPPGPLHRLTGFIIAIQRNVNREINRRLVAIRDGRGLGVVLAGLVIAFLYGVFHALGPGHGKAVIMGYFLGRGGGLTRGAAMAGWIALSHVAGAVVVVGLVHVLLAEVYVAPVEEMLWLRLASYGAILLIGLVMLAGALSKKRPGGVCNHEHHHSASEHGHGHARAEQRLLAVAAGFLPCSGAVLILVFALTNGILLTGLLMTLAIALGMGLTLAALGTAGLLVHRRVVGRFADAVQQPVLLNLLGPILIFAIGALLFAGALLDKYR
jgi:ABC-type nickel/cobalt efflux system permease component RcnA